MKTEKAYYSDLAIPPGEYLEEIIEDLGMVKDELAIRMNRPASKLSAIFKGEKAITPDTALQLEKVVGVPAHIWTGLESEYRLTLARQELQKDKKEEKKRLKTEASLITKYYYNALANSGVVPRHTIPEKKVEALQKFFGVTSLKTIPTLKTYQPAFKCGMAGKRTPSPEALAAWLRIGELKAIQMECAPFDKQGLVRALSDIRKMTITSPEKFPKELYSILANAGVALVLHPHLPKTYANGATFWMGKKKAVLLMSLRGKFADIVWFSLFHEIGHILLHKRQRVFIEIKGRVFADDLKDQENQADEFALNSLIPKRDYQKFIGDKIFFSENIREFAKQIGIHPGIVAGRLQHEGRIKKTWHHDLRTRFEWPEE